MKLFTLISAITCSHLLYSQNLGIGITTPAAPLHLKSNNQEILRLDGTAPYISFYNGTSYKGYLWHDGNSMILGSSTDQPVIISANYNLFPAYFTSNGRLGLGFALPSERLHVNGNINLSGLLKINGNAGTAGQVLTSNGASNPAWENAALSNNIRFAVSFATGPTPLDYGQIIFTRYNLNPAEVVISPSAITINRSGLYHFDIGVAAELTFPSSPGSFPFFGLDFFYGPPQSLPVIDDKPMYPTTGGHTSWIGNEKVSVELYVPAPATIRVFHLFRGHSGSSSYNVGGFIAGHLVSE